jgi:hypothetical protein
MPREYARPRRTSADSRVADDDNPDFVETVFRWR